MKDKFHEWLENVYFYYGVARYSQFKGYHVFAASIYHRDDIEELMSDLNASDIPALDAGFKLSEIESDEDEEVWISSDDNPLIAMNNLMDKIRTYWILLVK